MSQEGDQMINASNTEDANATSTKYWNIFSKCLNIENFVYRPLCVMIMSGLCRKGGGGETRGLWMVLRGRKKRIILFLGRYAINLANLNCMNKANRFKSFNLYDHHLQICHSIIELDLALKTEKKV